MCFDIIIESYQDELVRELQALIRIKSVRGVAEAGMPWGSGPYEALQYALNLCKDMGFKTKDIDGYAGHAELGQGEETIGVLVHLDVVPAGEEWTFPPFSAELHDGKIYGRGAIDDKGPVIAILYALKALKDSGIKLNRKIRVVFGTDEESGFDGIHYYLSKEKAFDMGFTPDARFPLISGEKGILLYKLSKEIKRKNTGDIQVTSIKGGSAPNMVPSFCQTVISAKSEKLSTLTDLILEFKQQVGFDIDIEVKDSLVVLSSSGRTAHASTPEEGVNAISIMMLFLSKLQLKEQDVSEVIKAYNQKIGLQYNGESLKGNYQDEMSGKLTLNVGLIDLNEDKFEMFIDMRYPISFTADEMIQSFHKAFAEEGVDIKELFAVAPIYFPEDHFLVQKLMKVYKDITQDQKSKPLVIGGATYARAMKNVIAFGPVFPDEEELAHKSNEYITVGNLLKMTKIYAKALYELAK